MPGDFLTDAERERFQSFPQEIHPQDVISYFTLSQADLSKIPVRSAPSNRLGFAILLSALRYLGFCPPDLMAAPSTVIAYVADQLELPPDVLGLYGQRSQTRTEHFHLICDYLGFSLTNKKILDELEGWLLQRALEHDKPALLLQMVCEKLRDEKFVRPGITSLERMVSAARAKATEETFSQLTSLLTMSQKKLLDGLLLPDSSTRRTPLTWLCQRSTSNSPKALLTSLEKLELLQQWGVEEWKLDFLHPNRLKFLAQIGRKSSNQALQRMSEVRWYPILLAFLRQSLVDITDELIDMFDRCLSQAYARSKRQYEEFRRSVDQNTNEKLHHFQTLVRVILDQKIPDPELRAAIDQHIPAEILQTLALECEGLIRPKHDSYFDYLKRRYSYLRQFSPRFLELLAFQSNSPEDSLLKAVEEIRQLNQEKRRKLPDDLPTDFIPKQWEPYVFEAQGEPERHYYELCNCAKLYVLEICGSQQAAAMQILKSIFYQDLGGHHIELKSVNSCRSRKTVLYG